MWLWLLILEWRVSAESNELLFPEWLDSMWAITGKQYWRCGVIRKRT